MFLPYPPPPHLFNRATIRGSYNLRRDGGKLSTGAIVGIVIGITVLAIITLVVLGFRCGWFRPRHRSKVEDVSVSKEDMINPMPEPQDAPDVAAKNWKRNLTWGKKSGRNGGVTEPAAAHTAV